ncbi:hypothetical protein BH23PLA1_BH23PLA1_27740 [soil metagenome]
MLSQTTDMGRTWDEAASPAAARLARRFEAEWRDSGRRRPEPADYLPEDPAEHSGAWLALLSAEMTLRFEAQEPVRVEDYQQRYPQLGDHILVALLYEEFCLREEAGQIPLPAEYERRFPALAAPLRRVLEIHKLVGGSGQPTALFSTWPGGEPIEFPEVGETIAGFHLVEILGKGSFARVFLARERLLADRPVALKVARGGSREPQALARLQHTHIVPVHSYRVDQQGTNLHLLCMPYFGRVTLSMLLADPAVASARSGTTLLEALARLEPPTESKKAPTDAQKALSGRTYSGAIAWWGARLAEALQHAHDRGVLHRDVKPSNVLVTGDGLPMLLDFNLAHEPKLQAPDAEPNALGGTLAYMAPEHLEALADGLADHVDERADLYALGVVLFEALAGVRPFPTIRNARSVPDALLRMAEQRRGGIPPLQRAGASVGPALEAIIRRCLAPDPADRYASAAELAADLQGVADDGPLRFTREPQPSRTLRWLRRKRSRFVVATPILLASLILAATFHDSRMAHVRDRNLVELYVKEGWTSARQEQFDKAIDRFVTAEQVAGDRQAFEGLAQDARQGRYYATEARGWRDRAEALFEEAEGLRLRLLGFVDDGEDLDAQVRDALRPFYVLENAGWSRLAHLDHLRVDQHKRLVDTVHQLLFLWALKLSQDDPEGSSGGGRALDLCDHALAGLSAGDPRRTPWQALWLRLDGPSTGSGYDPSDLMGADDHDLAVASFLMWAYHALCARVDDDPRQGRRAIAWLKRSCRLEPDDPWAQFYLAAYFVEVGREQDALEHAEAAVALRPGSPWARFNRAEVYRVLREWTRAREDLEAARRLVPPEDSDGLRERIDLNLGLTRLDLGDFEGAGPLFAQVLASAPESPYALAARLGRARLLAESGHPDRALAEYEMVLRIEPESPEALLGSALVALRLDQHEAAEARLNRLLAVAPRSAHALGLRSLARLGLGRLESAQEDAEAALAIDPSPSRERLQLRMLLANGQTDRLRLDDPDELDLLPGAGPGLIAELRSAAKALDRPGPEAESSPVPRLLTRAVLLSAIGDPEAESVARQAVILAPTSPEARWTRARLRDRSGDVEGALADAEAGLAIDPRHPRLLALRGLLKIESGATEPGLADLNRAGALAPGDLAVARYRARGLYRLGQDAEALAQWTIVLNRDPEDPRAYLARARVLRRLGDGEQALADLEQAASWAGNRPSLLGPITLSYSVSLLEHPDRRPRVVALARRLLAAGVDHARASDRFKVQVDR